MREGRQRAAKRLRFAYRGLELRRHNAGLTGALGALVLCTGVLLAYCAALALCGREAALLYAAALGALALACAALPPFGRFLWMECMPPHMRAALLKGLKE